MKVQSCREQVDTTEKNDLTEVGEGRGGERRGVYSKVRALAISVRAMKQCVCKCKSNAWST